MRRAMCWSTWKTRLARPAARSAPSCAAPSLAPAGCRSRPRRSPRRCAPEATRHTPNLAAAPPGLARTRADMRPTAAEPLAIFDFFKPGIEELCSILPPFLARPILAVAARRGWLGKVYWGMEVRSNAVGGFLRLKLLAKLRRWRRFTHRFAAQQTALEPCLPLATPP